MSRFKTMAIYLTLFWLFLVQGGLSHAQEAAGFGKKVNLDDVKIRGEVNKGQGMLSRRTRMNLDSRIKIPTNFRKAIIENLDPELAGVSKLDSKAKAIVLPEEK